MARTFDISKTPNSGVRLPAQDVAEAMKARGLTLVEASSLRGASLVQAPPVHGLLAAAHVAYAQHLPLVLSPDAVWVTIAQGLARHVDAHAEALRARLVGHQGSLELHVRRDEFVRGAANDWAGAIDELSQQLKTHLGSQRELFVADFTTTTTETRVASQVALLSGMQRFFSYGVSTLCGIPSVTLEGTPDDWAQVRQRVEALAELGLAHWARPLGRVVEQLHASARGEVNADFWSRLYKPIHNSGGDEVAGWLNALFPYLGDEGSRPNPALESWMDGDLDPEPFAAPKLSAFPTGVSQAPFVWTYFDEKWPMSFCAGAFGVEQDASGVRPRFGWAVTPRVVHRRFVARQELGGRQSLSPLDSKTLASLGSLAQETQGIGAFGLNLYWCERLRSLEGVESTALESINAMECNQLASLEALRGLTSLREVSISQGSGLRDISALSTLTGLRALSLTRCPNLEGLRVVASLEGLQALTLWHLPGLPAELNGQHLDPEKLARVKAALRV